MLLVLPFAGFCLVKPADNPILLPELCYYVIKHPGGPYPAARGSGPGCRRSDRAGASPSPPIIASRTTLRGRLRKRFSNSRPTSVRVRPAASSTRATAAGLAAGSGAGAIRSVSAGGRPPQRLLVIVHVSVPGILIAVTSTVKPAAAQYFRIRSANWRVPLVLRAQKPLPWP